MRIGGVALSVSINSRQAAQAGRGGILRRIARILSSQPEDLTRRSNAAPEELRRLDPSFAGTEEARQLIQRVNQLSWYHSIDLPAGITTPGLTDHRAQVSQYGLPDDMRGMRALDVATFDGFWAFEMERRGAEVTAVDIPRVYDADIPRRTLERLPADENHATGAGFRLAHEALGSRVERREMSVYEITPESLGTFDFVFMSDLLLHLRDPQRALERIYGVVCDDGQVIIAEPHDPELDLIDGMAVQQLVGYDRYVWAIPSARLLRRMLNVAGFSQIDEVARLHLNYRGTFPLEKVVMRAYPWQRSRTSAPDFAAPQLAASR